MPVNKQRIKNFTNRHPDDLIKRADKNPLEFEGYLVRFSDDRDRDLTQEWFSKNTWFMRSVAGYGIKGKPVNYQHGMDETFGAFPIGVFSFDDEDDIGLFVRGQLNTRREYIEMLRELGRVKGYTLSDSQLRKRADVAFKAVERLITEVPQQQSMGADLAAFKVDEKTGHIEQCGIVHGALTPTPADNKNPIVQFKSALNYVMAIENDSQTFLFNDGNSRQRASDNGTAKMVNPLKVNPDMAYVNASDSRFATHGNDNNSKENPVAKKSLKEMSPEERELLRSIVKEIVLELSEESDMEADDADVIAMVDEVEEEIKMSDEEEIKMSDEEDDDTTKAEELDEDEIVKRVKAYFALPTMIKQHLDARAKATKARKSIAKGALADHMNNAPTKSKKSQVGGMQVANNGGYSPTTPQSNSRISVWNERKYAGLTAESMALGLKIASQALYPYGAPEGTTLGDFVKSGIVSESYIKTMAHKAMPIIERADGFKSSGVFDNMMEHDRIAMKSAMPFKANELDAVSIANQGAEWAFIFYDTRLWERARHETELFNIMTSRGMRTADVTGKTMNVKLNTGSPTVYTAPEGMSVGADGRPEVVVQTTPFTTNEVQKDVKKHMLATGFTDELNEDSIIAIQQFLDQDVVTTLSEALEDAMNNGDTTADATNINTDSIPATGIQTPLYIAFDGLRHNWLVDNTGQGNATGVALALTDYEDTIMLLDPTIVNRRQNMLFVIDYKTESATRKLPELLTDDVKRSGGTAFAGQIGDLFSVPVYMSGFARLSEADGKISTVTPANNTKGTIQVIYAPYWQYGRSRDVTIELERYAQSSATVVVASVRHTLAARGAYASAGTYNITV